ncbi:MAG: thioesterase [Acidobacteriota bacterium]|nr:thioesterase [Acidobacteriota bacterium]
MIELEVGTEGEASRVVQTSDLASELSDGHSGTFPAVFSTSRLVALMELASARALLPVLGPGQLSVGVTVSITHTAATAPGARVRATARFTGQQGKFYAFEVAAFDPAGEIGKGTHLRAVIDAERLIRGADNRARREDPS